MNFGKEEKSKKGPLICFECEKPGHMKIDYHKLKKDLRKDKKNTKEKF